MAHWIPKLALLPLLCVLSVAANAQSIINVDYTTGKVTSPKLAHDSTYSVVLNGKNTGRYKITVTTANNNVFRTAPAAFTPSSSKPAATVPSKAGGGNGPLTMAEIHDVDSLNQVLTTITAEAKTSLAYMNQSPSATDAKLEAIRFINDLRKIQGQPLISPDAASTDSTIGSSYTAIINQLFSKLTTVEEEEKNPLTSKLRDLTTVLNNQKAKVPKDETATKAAQDDVTKATQDLTAFALQVDNKAKALTDQQTTLVGEAVKIQENLNRAVTGDLFTSTFGPFQATGDQVAVTIAIEDTIKEVPDSTTTYTVPITKGFKIDFSTGLIYTSLHDFNYTTNPVSGSSPATYTVNSPTSTNGRVLTAAFIHFRGIFGDWVGENFSLSLGIVPNDVPVYAIGLGFHSQSLSQRLVIVAGFALGQVNRYDGPATISTTTVPVTERYMTRPFVGLTYNF